jgi:hypothetical protein
MTLAMHKVVIHKGGGYDRLKLEMHPAYTWRSAGPDPHTGGGGELCQRSNVRSSLKLALTRQN